MIIEAVNTIEMYADLRAVIDSDIPDALKHAATIQTLEDDAPDLAERIGNDDRTGTSPTSPFTTK